MLDEEVAAAGAVTKQRGDLVRGVGIDLAALRHGARAPPALAGMLEMPDFVDVCVCVSGFLAHRALIFGRLRRLFWP